MNLPVVNESTILLVPKKVVVFKPEISSADFYSHDVLSYLQSEHIAAKSSLVEVLKNGELRVTKKALKEQPEYRFTKEYLYDFCNKHPEVLDRYKERRAKQVHKSSDVDIYFDFDMSETDSAEILIEELVSIPTGNDTANQYHSFCIGLLEFLFFPDFSIPYKEFSIHSGRKRIDIAYYNGATEGFFYDLKIDDNTRATQIIIECKNYSHDPKNPELDQLSGRFSPLRGWFGILMARSFDDKERFVERCKDTAKDKRGIIIPLCDNDIITMLKLVINDERHKLGAHLQRYYMEIIS